MMSELPVESVNGQSEWDWNEQQTAQKISDSPSGAAGYRSAGPDRDTTADRAIRTRREVERLKLELEQKDQQLRHLTDQYELLLAEKNQQLADQNKSESGEKRQPTLRSTLSRLVIGRR